jgi:hypothetical protein
MAKERKGKGVSGMGESSLNMYWFNYGSRFELPEATEAQLDKLESIVLVSKG